MAIAVGAVTETENISPGNGVLVVSGFGVKIFVERGALIVEDGIGSRRRKGQFYRANSGVNRLVMIGHSGSITFDALRWLNDIGAAVIQLDSDGNVILASTARALNDSRLRRAQALAASTNVGPSIVRDILTAKLSAQIGVLGRFTDSQAQQDEIRWLITELGSQENSRDLMIIEARAAAQYWSAWKAASITFARKDASKIADHWKTFETRRSAISGASRLASTPINAMLNYLYGVLETEVRLAILSIGLDPGMALLHSDQPQRDSFVFDVIEPLRPLVDKYLLDLLEQRTFAASDFHETRQGVIRIMPTLAKTFAEFGPELSKAVRPLVEQIALRLSESTSKPFAIPTVLTQANRSSGRDGVRKVNKKVIAPKPISVESACIECGTILETPDRTYCDDCLPEQLELQRKSFTTVGRARLQELRTQGIDPSTGSEANAKRRLTMAQRRKDEIEWNALNPDQTVDEEWFKTTVIPVLQSMTLSKISGATGLSQQYCSLIKRGQKIPHPRHLERFRLLVTRQTSMSND